VAFLLMLGGVLYTVGVVFHLWERLPFQNAIWHGFVLVAASVHFAAVVDIVGS
jgi:hemolysin III